MCTTCTFVYTSHIMENKKGDVFRRIKKGKIIGKPYKTAEREGLCRQKITSSGFVPVHRIFMGMSV